ncbi:hypothetical protein [Bradyrhizobium sp. CW9]|uniref:hypothetical protein n=1 Tax=Bradyrhizobium sp. CW9 TaxID=2782689 RepID=UPI001FF77A58|nr:hypothetical protein [Bradyrhizobium sp. CW9]
MPKLGLRLRERTQPLNGHRREVGPAIYVTAGRELFDEQADAAPDLQQPPCAKSTNLQDRMIEPIDHIGFGNGPVGEVAGPTDE